MTRICFSIILAAMFGPLASAALLPPTITPIPASGNVAGMQGTVVGWGFTLTNPDASDWVVLTGSSFTGSQVLGHYVDYLAASFWVAGPAPESSTIQQVWNQASLLGLGEFDINKVAAPGLIGGNIVVHYSEFSQDPNDPNFDPDTSTVIADGTLATQVGISINAVPETGTLGLLLAGALPFVLRRHCRCRDSFNAEAQRTPR
jgi:hypothetical protein